MFYCLDIIGVISHTYQYFALPTPHSVADKESDIKNIFKINFPDSLDVNAAVKESRNPGSILPLNRNQSIIIWCIINHVRDIRNLHPPPSPHIHTPNSKSLRPIHLFRNVIYTPEGGHPTPRGSIYRGGGAVSPNPS